MNEVVKSILSRRSIRSYTDEMVEKADLELIAEAGIYAPSAMNRQPWKVVVIQNPVTVQAISTACRSGDRDPLYHAKTLIVTFADKERSSRVIDGTLAMANMMQTAHALGLGSCWIGSVKDYFITDEGLTFVREHDLENYECIGGMIVGHIAGELPEAKERVANLVVYVD